MAIDFFCIAQKCQATYKFFSIIESMVEIKPLSIEQLNFLDSTKQTFAMI
jgi:hypothetical protein